uniref:Putative ixostatin n=1 Tax=Ixodes ricinus TaxID=34613 RepID=A0A0K8RB78_IXORI
MIVTEVFLLFVAVPLACVAEETPQVPEGCRLVGDSLFNNALCHDSLRSALGDYCRRIYANKGNGGQWIGDIGQRTDDCKVCCIRKFENGTETYDPTTAPNTLPCGKNKTCQEGRCRRKPSASRTGV